MHDYVHIDVSGEFTGGAKWVVGLFWLVSILTVTALALTNNKTSPFQGWIALTLGIGMILLRLVFLAVGLAPYFDVTRAVPVEGAIFLGNMIFWKVCLEKHYPACRRTLRNRIHNKKGAKKQQDALSFTRLASPFYASTIVSSLLTPNVAMSLLGSSVEEKNEEEEENKVVLISHADFLSDIMLLAGSAIGSALTVTGNLHNVLIVLCFAYDDIGWLEFSTNLLLPVAFVLCLFALIFILSIGFGYCCFTPQSNTRQGSLSSVVEYKDQNTADIMERSNDDDDNDNLVEEVPPSSKVQEDSFCSDQGDDSNTPTTTLTESSSNSSNDGDLLSVNNSSRWQSGCVLVAVLVLVAGSAATGSSGAGHVLLVEITVVLVLFWIAQVAATRGLQNNRRRALSSTTTLQLEDAEPVLTYIGIALLTASFSDSGVPQAIWVSLTTLGDDNNECYMHVDCLLRAALVNYVIGVFFTPMAATFVLAATLPYVAPYYWVQISWHMSVASVTRTVLFSSRGGLWTTRTTLFSRSHKCMFMVVTVLLSLAILWLGTKTLEYLHFSPECSMKLGECDTSP